MFYHFKKNKRAFTLVELIVVIAIIAILGTVVGVSVSGFVASAKKRAVESAANSLKTTWDLFLADGGETRLNVFLSENMDDISDVYFKAGNKCTVSMQAKVASEATCNLYVYKDGYLATVSIVNGEAAYDGSSKRNAALPSGASKVTAG